MSDLDKRYKVDVFRKSGLLNMPSTSVRLSVGDISVVCSEHPNIDKNLNKAFVEVSVKQQDKIEKLQARLDDLIISSLFALGGLAAKKEWRMAKSLALALKKQDVDCDYIQPILDKEEGLE